MARLPRPALHSMGRAYRKRRRAGRPGIAQEEASRSIRAHAGAPPPASAVHGSRSPSPCLATRPRPGEPRGCNPARAVHRESRAGRPSPEVVVEPGTTGPRRRPTALDDRAPRRGTEIYTRGTSPVGAWPDLRLGCSGQSRGPGVPPLSSPRAPTATGATAGVGPRGASTRPTWPGGRSAIPAPRTPDGPARPTPRPCSAGPRRWASTRRARRSASACPATSSRPATSPT